MKAVTWSLANLDSFCFTVIYFAMGSPFIAISYLSQSVLITLQFTASVSGTPDGLYRLGINFPICLLRSTSFLILYNHCFNIFHYSFPTFFESDTLSSLQSIISGIMSSLNENLRNLISTTFGWSCSWSTSSLCLSLWSSSRTEKSRNAMHYDLKGFVVKRWQCKLITGFILSTLGKGRLL